MLIKETGRSVTIGSHVDSTTVRHWLLFWDEFNCPTNSFIGTGLSPDLQYLEDCGFLRRNHVRMSGSISSGEFGKLFLAAQHITYNQLNEAEPGKWTVASSDGIISAQAPPSLESSLIFELINVFQVPEDTVSIDDILEFKAQRGDELQAFHKHLEEIYSRISASRDIIRSRTVEISNLESTLCDYNKVLAESFPKRSMRSLKVILDRSLIESSGIGMAGAALAPQIGLPTLGFGVFAASAAFVLRNVLHTNASSAHPLTYVSSIDRYL